MRWWFLDRIDELISGAHAVGRKGVASSEDYFTDHFPGFPVLPGVVQVEALAQLSGKLVEVTIFDQRGVWMWPILSMVRKAKFRRFVRPGDTVILKSTLKELREESAICGVVAEVDGRKVSEAELLFVFNPEGLDTNQAQLDLETLERKNLKMLWDGYEAWVHER
ncbi:beta-hydroxyacyl-ACP dehydratase [Myxococcota bacterium]|nr:beta-hydroxyacyl-ACP dehydratase [Myxococcota bacterium]MBU1430883.1 beta-hydroxyacyl-ACP dehydratase [Myxococcota bacterium]MBU1900175.1 beta-hydroxyacyl-ACP dehydratase [Myxococcota bacterium]